MEISKSFKYDFHTRYEHRECVLPTSSYGCEVIGIDFPDGFHDSPNSEGRRLLKGQVPQLYS